MHLRCRRRPPAACLTLGRERLSWQKMLRQHPSSLTSILLPHILSAQKMPTPPIMLPSGSTASNGGEAPAAPGAAKPPPAPWVSALPRPSAVRDAPDEVMLASTDEAYVEYREMTDMREPYRWVACAAARGSGCMRAGRPRILVCGCQSACLVARLTSAR